MLSFIRGTVESISGNVVTIDVGGVGFSISVTPRTLSGMKLGQPATVSVSLIVREDSMSLYGFSNTDERRLFEILQTVSGVGPRLAQTILAAVEPEALATALASGDETTLMHIPGVGKKSAARLILEIGDKVQAVAVATPQPTWKDDVHAALVSLGWSAKEATTAVDSVASTDVDTSDPGSALRAALSTLNRSGRG